jgi:hypothetical protein
MALSDINEKAVSLDFDKGAFFNRRANFGICLGFRPVA